MNAERRSLRIEMASVSSPARTQTARLSEEQSRMFADTLLTA